MEVKLEETAPVPCDVVRKHVVVEVSFKDRGYARKGGHPHYHRRGHSTSATSGSVPHSNELGLKQICRRCVTNNPIAAHIAKADIVLEML